MNFLNVFFTLRVSQKHSIISIKELTSQPKHCNSGPMLMESSSITMSTTILKHSLAEQVNSLFKKELELYKLGRSSQEDWGRVLQKVVYALNLRPVYAMVSPIVRIHGSRNQSVDMGMVPFIVTLVIH